MAFETGTYTSVSDLLSKLNTFASSFVPAAAQWTVTTGGLGSQVSFDDGSGNFAVNIIPLGGTNLGEWHYQPSTSVGASSLAFYNHPGSPDNSGTTGQFCVMGGIDDSGGTYYFFSPDTAPKYLHVVANPSAGVFTHCAFGTCETFGSGTFGQYCTGLSWQATGNTSAHLPFADKAITTRSTSWLRRDGIFGGGTPSWTENWGMAYGQSLSTTTGFVDHLIMQGISELTQRSPLIPNYVKVEESTADPDENVIVGHLPDLRFVNLDQRFPTPNAEILTIGSDQWYVTAMRTKEQDATATMFSVNGTGAGTTRMMGLAYRRI